MRATCGHAGPSVDRCRGRNFIHDNREQEKGVRVSVHSGGGGGVGGGGEEVVGGWGGVCVFS